MLMNAEDAKQHCVLITGITLSGMLRTFEKETNDKLLKKLPGIIEKVYRVKSADEFNKIHSNFCQWGIKNIKRNGRASKDKASYGQIAKTFNVILKVVIYYSQYPNYKYSKRISTYLHAAVDNNMMTMLKKEYPKGLEKWPTNIVGVDKECYDGIQKLVGRFIADKHSNSISYVQFDDIYWIEQNRKVRRK